MVSFVDYHPILVRFITVIAVNRTVWNILIWEVWAASNIYGESAINVDHLTINHLQNWTFLSIIRELYVISRNPNMWLNNVEILLCCRDSEQAPAVWGSSASYTTASSSQQRHSVGSTELPCDSCS